MGKDGNSPFLLRNEGRVFVLLNGMRILKYIVKDNQLIPERQLTFNDLLATPPSSQHDRSTTQMLPRHLSQLLALALFPKSGV